MIDPLAMPIFKPLWEAFPYLPGCFAAWRGMSLGEISASAYAAADGERRPSDAIVDCMAKHAARKFGIPARAAILPRGRPGTVPAVPEFLAGYRGTECPRLGRKGRTFKCRPLEADQGL